MKRKDRFNFVIISIIYFSAACQLTFGNVSIIMKNDDCDSDLKYFGLDEMVRHVERAVDECELVSGTRGELFKCFYKRVNMTEFSDEDGARAMRHAIEKYLPNAYPAKVLKDSDEYATKIKLCAANYTLEGGAKRADLATVHGFLECFYNVTQKFATDIREYCKSLDTDDDETTTLNSKNVT